MASRSGRMVEGTDGNDHLFRERVSSQYQVSAKNKSLLKLFLFAHWLLAGAQILLLLPFTPFPSFPLTGLHLEYAWLGSLPFTLLAASACNKSKLGQMNVFKYSIIFLGVLPCLGLIGVQAPVTVQYLNSCVGGDSCDTDIVMWQGYPSAVISTGLSILNLIVHIGQLKVASTLLAAWAPRHQKRS